LKRYAPKKPTALKAMDAKGSEYTRAMDAFQNVLARIGTNTPNLMEGANYPLTRLTRNYQLMNSLYRSHWIVRKIIDVPQEDMLKNWIELNTDADPEQIDKFQKVIRKTQTRAKFLSGLKWGRLYGGAAGIMMIKGHEKILSEPLDYDAVMPDSYKGLLVVDRWSGISPSVDTVTDINSPDFGLPEMYSITVNDGKTYDVHSSRVIRFIGRDLPEWEAQAEQRWGISEIELVFDELKKRDNTSWNIASLVFLANVRVLKMGDLAQMLSVNNPTAQQKLYNTLQSQNWLMSNMGMMVLNKDDDFDNKQFTFSGLNDIYQSFMLDIAGCAEIPVTKLFGRAPAGMNATGESDLQNYSDTISERQESHARPGLDKLLPIVALSTWGMIPDDFDYAFNPSRTLTNEERADLADKKSKSIVEVYNAGIIDRTQALKELQQLEDETGMFSNITDEDIAAAKLEPKPIPGEMDLESLLRKPAQVDA
jgi:phage-related protein (TIGR01555 family)